MPRSCTFTNWAKIDDNYERLLRAPYCVPVQTMGFCDLRAVHSCSSCDMYTIYRSLNQIKTGWSDITLLKAPGCPVQCCRNLLGRSLPLRKPRPEIRLIFNKFLRQARCIYAGSKGYSIVGPVKCTDDKEFHRFTDRILSFPILAVDGMRQSQASTLKAVD